VTRDWRISRNRNGYNIAGYPAGRELSGQQPASLTEKILASRRVLVSMDAAS
jgi:hypothetical protein